ncbi:MAG: FHA domain-containing serine/threonine-protein kinase [Planctomycetota bacterium]
MKYQVTVTAGPDTGRKFAIDSGRPLSIGRGQASDTQINDPRMSRVHCRLEWEGAGLRLVDAGSSSGTRVGGEVVDAVSLKVGQSFTAGESTLRLDSINTADAATMAGPAPGVAEPASAADLKSLVGQTFSDFRLDEVLTVGKSGLVFRGTDTAKDRPVAVKVLTPNFTASEEQRDRFVRAMKTMLPLKHPNIVRILQAGKKGPYCWAAMELIEGESLAKVIERTGIDGMLDWKEVWRVGMDIASALAAAHAQQIIHRNVTPTNILRRSSDKACLLGDLMLAKALEGTLAKEVTQPGQLLGELPYSSPERTGTDATVDARSDLYELGGTLYALLTGRAPAAGKSLVEIIQQVRGVMPEPPKKFQLSVNELFQDSIMRLLAKKPEDRYASAEAFLSDLERIGKFNSLIPMG